MTIDDIKDRLKTLMDDANSQVAKPNHDMPGQAGWLRGFSAGLDIASRLISQLDQPKNPQRQMMLGDNTVFLVTAAILIATIGILVWS